MSKQQNGSQSYESESAMVRVAGCWKLESGTRFQVQLIKAPANVKGAITLVRARNERRYNERAMARVAKRWK